MNRRLQSVVLSLLASVAVLVSTVSCRHRAGDEEHRAVQVYDDADRIEAEAGAFSPLTAARADSAWADVTINGRITMTAGQSRFSSNVQVRMVRGKSVSLSLRPFMGIEMGKIYAAGDSVTIVDKYHKACSKEALVVLFGGLSDISSLQQMLLARPFLSGYGPLDDDKAALFECTQSDTGGQWVMIPVGQPQGAAYHFEMQGNSLLRLNMAAIVGDVVYGSVVDYGGYADTPMGVVATRLLLEMNAGNMTTEALLEYKVPMRWNTGIQDTVRIPENAQLYSFPEIINLISQQSEDEEK